MISLDPKTTALVMIDLQKGIAGNPLAPRSGAEVVDCAKTLVAKFRAASAPVIWVRVSFAPDFADAPRQQVDEPMRMNLPPGWDELIEGLAAPGDLVVVKRQWGAFYGTELDLLLRRRGVKTVVLGGIATNFGVESTARDAWERGYELVTVEDACASRSAALHDFAINAIFPRLSRVTRAEEIVLTEGAA